VLLVGDTTRRVVFNTGRQVGTKVGVLARSVMAPRTRRGGNDMRR
jgi:hypothetical protein